jgi:hypothetical protein
MATPSELRVDWSVLTADSDPANPLEHAESGTTRTAAARRATSERRGCILEG